MARPSSSSRLLWNHPSVIMIAAAGLTVSIAIILVQMRLRQGLLDPLAVNIFDHLFLFRDYAAGFAFVAALLLALVPAVQGAGERLARWLGEQPGIASTIAGVLLAIGAKYLYLEHPLAMDEAAPYMQSLIFASGSLMGRFPAELADWLVFEGFQGHFIHVSHETGQVASAYWPGFALLLTPFTAAGVPWLCNPVLGAISLWLIHRLNLRLTDSPEAAGTSILFAFASAAFVVNAFSFYSMTAHLMCNTAFVLLLLTPTPARALAAGAVGGLALTLHNPLRHILFAIPWLVWLVPRSDRWRVMTAMAVGYPPRVAIVGFGWHYLMMQQLGHAPVDPGSETWGGGPLGEALRMLSKVVAVPGPDILAARLIALAKLWVWAVPGLLLLAIAGLWQWRSDLRFRLLLASALLTFAGFLFIPVSQGHGWGFRYFHSAWAVIPLFAAAVGTRRQGDVNTSAGAIVQTALRRFGQGAAVASLLLLLPFFGWQVGDFFATHLAQMPSAPAGENRVVIVNPYLGYYAQDLVQNDPFLRAGTIVMITRGRKQDQTMIEEHFPGLKLLGRDYRGTVWGYPEPRAAASLPVDAADQHRDEE